MNEAKKRRAILRLVISAIILLALMSILIHGLYGRGNGWNFPFFSIGFGDTYADADKYAIGDTSISADSLDEIDIDWIGGKLQIETYEGDAIELQETAPGVIDEDDRVRSYYDNGVLKIRFRKSEFLAFRLKSIDKTLTIRIPEKLYSNPNASLTNLDIDNVSADVSVSGLRIHQCTVDTVSGDISLDGAVEQLETDSVSGDCQLTSSTTPANIDTDSVSGDVMITVPGDSQFSIDYDSVSGDLTNDFPTTGNSQSNHWEFDSVSGNVTIRKGA